jgi:hypothetical protein
LQNNACAQPPICLQLPTPISRKKSYAEVVPFLWFDHQAEEAANFYTSLFKNCKILVITRYDGESAEASGRPAVSIGQHASQANTRVILSEAKNPRKVHSEIGACRLSLLHSRC